MNMRLSGRFLFAQTQNIPPPLQIDSVIVAGYALYFAQTKLFGFAHGQNGGELVGWSSDGSEA